MHSKGKVREPERKEYQSLINQNSSPSTKNIIQSKLTFVNAEVWPKNHPNAKKLNASIAETMAVDFQPCSRYS